jgi:hypothetical protein
VIAESARNLGSFRWDVPSSVPSGKFIVRIRTHDSASARRNTYPSDVSEEFEITDPVPKPDLDKDKIPDELELELATRFAPEVRLAPKSKDETRPASVDWYLDRVRLRFHHNNAPDCQIKGVGRVTQSNLHRQSHKKNRRLRLRGWTHEKPRLKSSEKQRHFFLQPPDDDVHKGAPKSDWTVYVHVRKSKRISGGFDIQYWFFYPYNDFVAKANHEGDWEHITVTLNPDQTFESAWYAQHESGKRYFTKDDMRRLQSDPWCRFVDGTHPVVYSADGSHASYPDAKKGQVCTFSLSGASVTLPADNTYDGGPIWKTWKKLVNVGEKDAPLNGQEFILFGGLWGEIGMTKWTSGPHGPAFQSAWSKKEG